MPVGVASKNSNLALYGPIAPATDALQACVSQSTKQTCSPALSTHAYEFDALDKGLFFIFACDKTKRVLQSCAASELGQADYFPGASSDLILNLVQSESKLIVACANKLHVAFIEMGIYFLKS